MKNDNSFFEKVKPRPRTSASRRPERKKTWHCMPKTYNDYKVIGISASHVVMSIAVLALCVVGMVLSKLEPWVSVTAGLWFLSCWYCIFGTFAYINRLYVLTSTAVLYLGVACALPLGWCFLMCACSLLPNSTTENVLVAVSVTLLYYAAYFSVLGAYMILDTSSFKLANLVSGRSW